MDLQYPSIPRAAPVALLLRLYGRTGLRGGRGVGAFGEEKVRAPTFLLA